MKRIRKSEAKTGLGLLLAVKRAILKEPARINMENWVIALKGKVIDQAAINHHAVELPECGTVGCIAGWVNILGGTIGKDGYPVDGRLSTSTTATNLLVGKDAPEEVKRSFGYDLFYSNMSLPHPGTPAYARAVADKIDEFIVRFKPYLQANRL